MYSLQSSIFNLHRNIIMHNYLNNDYVLKIFSYFKLDFCVVENAWMKSTTLSDLNYQQQFSIHAQFTKINASVPITRQREHKQHARKFFNYVLFGYYRLNIKWLVRIKLDIFIWLRSLVSFGYFHNGLPIMQLNIKQFFGQF